jgi:hypothetical protein
MVAVKSPSLPAVGTALAVACAAASPLAAQVDYRNLDDHRPVRTEDAYTIERYAFEFMLPAEYGADVSGERTLVVAPEVAYGIVMNGQVGLKVPVARRQDDGAAGEWGLTGPRLFALYNLNTECPKLPGFALRTDLAIPIGGLAGSGARVSVKAMATRGWGLTRLHVNAGASFGSGGVEAAVDAEPDWMVTAALDRTLLRHSLLVIGELAVLRAPESDATEVTASIGARIQLTPTLVLDGGVGRRLTSDAGPDFEITVGLTHAFGIAGLMPRGGS